MLNAQEVLISIAMFFGVVSVIGVVTVKVLSHMADRNEKNN
jgi:hypothetical protein